MNRRILHPSDYSRASGAAFKKAVEMAKAGRAELTVIHVVSPVAPIAAGDGYCLTEDLRGHRCVGQGVGSETARQAAREGEAVRRPREGIRARRVGARADRPLRPVQARGPSRPGHAWALGAREAVPRQRGGSGGRSRPVPGPDRTREIGGSVARWTPSSSSMTRRTSSRLTSGCSTAGLPRSVCRLLSRGAPDHRARAAGARGHRPAPVRRRRPEHRPSRAPNTDPDAVARCHRFRLRGGAAWPRWRPAPRGISPSRSPHPTSSRSCSSTLITRQQP